MATRRPRSQCSSVVMNDEWSSDNKTKSDFSSYSPATVLMFALGSMGVALALVPIILPSSDLMDFIEYMVYSSLRIVCSVVVTIICLCLVYYKRNLIKLCLWPGVDTGTRSNNSSWSFRFGLPGTHFGGSQAKYMLFTTIVFGICSIIRCILRLLVDVRFDLNVPAMPYLDHITDIISLCSQMLFFCYYNGGILPNVRGLHYTIACLIVIKLCTWVSATLIPLWDLETDELFDNSAVNISENLEFSEEFFETFYTEFHTIAIGVLFFIWHSMEKFEQPKLSLENETQDATLPLLGDYRPDSLVDEEVEERRIRRSKVIATAVSIMLNVLYATTSLLLAKGSMMTNPSAREYAGRGIGIAYFGGVTIIAILQLYKLRLQPDIVLPFFNSSEYVLLLTACSEAMYQFLRIVAAISFLSKRVVEWTPFTKDQTYMFESDETYAVDNSMSLTFLFYAMCVITSIWAQTMLLIVARRKHVSASVKHFLIYIACFNFADWLQSAIRLGLGRSDDTHNLTPVMNWCFGYEKTRIIVLLLLPMMVLFRFHSAIVSIELVNET